MGTVALIGVAGGAALLALVGARAGLLRLRRYRRDAERVRVEDALKHLLGSERAGRSCTLEGVAGRLEVSRGVASDVLTLLTQRGLARAGEAGFRLTESGRGYALRVVRTHRLWERYLADRTGVPPAEWHAAAERVEHRLSAEEAEHLAARLGHPRYDPHGDPIPTARGEIPAPAGAPLTHMSAGDRVVVVHVEDEPPEVFERLAAAGVAPGLALEVLDSADGAVGLRAGGRAVSLGPVEAGNVTVERVPGTARAAEAAAGSAPGRTLADVEPGETVRVASIAPRCQGPQRRRLLDLGVVPGTRITPELRSVSGDPVAYRIRGALIALRREQASWIEVAVEPAERAG